MSEERAVSGSPDREARIEAAVDELDARLPLTPGSRIQLREAIEALAPFLVSPDGQEKARPGADEVADESNRPECCVTRPGTQVDLSRTDEVVVKRVDLETDLEHLGSVDWVEARERLRAALSTGKEDTE